VVEGFSLQFTRKCSDGGRADLVESGGVTEGKLYRIPLAAFEGYLCQREGVAAGIYRPVVVPVHGMDGTIEDALTFVVVEKGEEAVPPQHYMVEILRGAEPVVSEGYYQQLLRRFVNDFGFVMEEI
jgi:cation transport regulator ChaC